MRSLSEIEAKTVALWVADNQLTLLQLDPQPPTLARHSDTTVMAGETSHWRYRGQETSDAGMRAIAIEVRRDPQDRNVLAELQAYRGCHEARFATRLYAGGNAAGYCPVRHAVAHRPGGLQGRTEKRRNYPAQIDAADPAATGAGDRRARFCSCAGACADR